MEVVTGSERWSPVGRWSGLGPYYAMFPIDFAFQTVREFSEPGSHILDPFAGRGTSIFAAAAQGRSGIGVEINPVGWVYGQTKLHPATQVSVEASLKQIASSSVCVQKELDELPAFFSRCFSQTSLNFLLRARKQLDWKYNSADRTLMAIILVNLHGKAGSAFSNQMRQGKAMAPDYSVRWWDARGLMPPELDPEKFLESRIRWRYSKGFISAKKSHIIHDDSLIALPELAKDWKQKKKCDLLLTSPPYYSITNYYYDQWLRLWMLGGPSKPQSGLGANRGRFDSKDDYCQLLKDVFASSAEIMSKKSIIYVRTDAREFTLETTTEALKLAFPKKKMEHHARPFAALTQTALFGDKTGKPGEVDIILR